MSASNFVVVARESPSWSNQSTQLLRVATTGALDIEYQGLQQQQPNGTTNKDDLVDSLSNIRTGTSMPRYLVPNMPCLFGRDLPVCDSCCVKLTLFKRKKLCTQCRKVFCMQCIAISSDKTVQCRICMVLCMRPPNKQLLLELRVKDLQQFLTAHHVSTHGCVEKEDLVNLLLCYSNQKSNPGNSSSFYTLYPGSSNFPDEVGVDIGATVSGTTSSAAGASTSVSSPVSDCTTNRELDDASPNLQSGKSKNYGLQPDEVARVTEAIEEAGSNQNLFEEGASAPAVEDFDVEQSSSSPAGPSASVDEAEASTSDVFPERRASADDGALADAPGLSPPGSPRIPPVGSATASPLLAGPTMSSIQCKEEMEQMSVRQLKCLLVRHRVDYHGCCEKAELVERATRLWNDYRASRADLDNLALDGLCKVCMDAPIECVMLECGHMATCTDCGRQLYECPICRQYVVRIVRTFRA